MDFSAELKHHGTICQMRVLKDREIYDSIHDRWMISQNICLNAPSPDIVARGQYSEIKTTNYRPPFEKWWDNSLDIATDWNEIQRIKNLKR